MEAKNQIDEIAGSAKEYVNLQWEILRLEFIGSVSKQGAALVSSAIVLFMVLLIFTLLNAAAALYLGDVLHDRTLGFAVLAGIDIFLVMIIYIFRERLIKRPVRNKIISRLTKHAS